MKSLFDKNLFLESVKQSKYVIILHTFAIFVMTTLSAYMTRWQYKEELLTENDYPRALEAIKNNLMGYNSAMFWIIVFAVAVTVVVNFSYLFKTNSMQFYNSMPYKRSCMYISKAASCFVGLLAPVITVLGINLFIYYGNMGLSDKAPVTELLNIASNVIICYSVVLSIALFAVSVSGNVFATAFASGFAALWHIVTVISVVMCCYVWFESFEITPDDNLMFMFPPTLFLEHLEREDGWQNVFWAFSAINIIAFPLLGLWCYTKRKSENTTKFFVFDKLASFFKYYVSFIGALGFGCIFADFDIPVLLVLVSYGIVFVVLYCILQALFAKNMPSLFKNIKKPLIVSIVFILLLVPFVYGMVEPGAISPALCESVEIRNSDFEVVITDKELIEKTIEYTKTEGEGNIYLYCHIDLKLPFLKASNNYFYLSDDKYEEYLDAVLSCEEYIDNAEKNINESNSLEVATPSGIASYFTAEKVDKCREYMKLLVEEMRSYDYKTKKDSGVYGVVDNKEGDLNIRVYNCYKKFIKTIEENEEWEERPYDINQVEVQSYCYYLSDEPKSLCNVYSTTDEKIIEKFTKLRLYYSVEECQPIRIKLSKAYTIEEQMQLSSLGSWMPYEEYFLNYYDLPKEIRELINPKEYEYREFAVNAQMHFH